MPQNYYQLVETERQTHLEVGYKEYMANTDRMVQQPLWIYRKKFPLMQSIPISLCMVKMC